MKNIIRLAIDDLGQQKVLALRMGSSEVDVSKILQNQRGICLDNIPDFLLVCGLKIVHADENLIKEQCKKINELEDENSELRKIIWERK